MMTKIERSYRRSLKTLTPEQRAKTILGIVEQKVLPVWERLQEDHIVDFEYIIKTYKKWIDSTVTRRELSIAQKMVVIMKNNNLGFRYRTMRSARYIADLLVQIIDTGNYEMAFDLIVNNVLQMRKDLAFSTNSTAEKWPERSKAVSDAQYDELNSIISIMQSVE